jgi:hypothetical protein
MLVTSVSFKLPALNDLHPCSYTYPDMKRRAPSHVVVDDDESTPTPVAATASASTSTPAVAMATTSSPRSPSNYISGAELTELSHNTAFQGFHRKHDRMNAIVGDRFTYIYLVDHATRVPIRWVHNGIPRADPMGQIRGVTPDGKYLQVCSFGKPWSGTMDTIEDEATFRFQVRAITCMMIARGQ